LAAAVSFFYYMKFIAKPLLYSRAVLFSRAIALAAILALTSTAALAADAALNYLKAGQPDAAVLLAPPPLQDSPEALADLDEVRAVYHAAGSNDQAAAYSEKSFTVFNFAEAAGPFFVESNLPTTAAFFEKVQKDAETVTDTGKDFFRRPRPYSTDPSLANGRLEKSFSYPSGHSTESMVLALVLADLLPEKHDAIIAHARQMGWHRVQIARHYPTDIFAGRTLALAIVRELKKSPDFQRDFEAAKAELAAAQAK
jgi:acid phosphatase (class A)